MILPARSYFRKLILPFIIDEPPGPSTFLQAGEIKRALDKSAKASILFISSKRIKEVFSYAEAFWQYNFGPLMLVRNIAFYESFRIITSDHKLLKIGIHA